MSKKKKAPATEFTVTILDIEEAERRKILTVIPPEQVSKEISPSNTTLRGMRQIVGNDGVVGQHSDGNNESRPTEEHLIWKEGKKK